MNFILQISSKCGQGGRGSKNPKNLHTYFMDAPQERNVCLGASFASRRGRQAADCHIVGIAHNGTRSVADEADQITPKDDEDGQVVTAHHSI